MVPRGDQEMEPEVQVRLLVAANLVLLLGLVAVTAAGPLMRELQQLVLVVKARLQRAATRARMEELELERMVGLAQMPAPLLPLLPLNRAQMVQRPISQETLQALRAPKPRLVPLPPVLQPPTPMQSSLG
jgi:hypothetical protein